MQKPKVLICDDEEGVRESLKLILERDYESITANDAQEVLAKLKQQHDIKVVLMDIKMPKTNGLEALKQIKVQYPGVAVIMITGYQTTEAATEAIKLGAMDYILKPIDSGSVLASIRRAL
ncbi:MAG: response regulator [Candidatus Omnitrophota bacterium]